MDRMISQKNSIFIGGEREVRRRAIESILRQMTSSYIVFDPEFEMVDTARFLYENGYKTVRMNLEDASKEDWIDMYYEPKALFLTTKDSNKDIIAEYFKRMIINIRSNNIRAFHEHSPEYVIQFVLYDFDKIGRIPYLDQVITAGEYDFLSVVMETESIEELRKNWDIKRENGTWEEWRTLFTECDNLFFLDKSYEFSSIRNDMVDY